MSSLKLKSFGIQLNDIWIECQKEMIEMRDKIFCLNNCLKTWQMIAKHLSDCNENLVVLVEKSRLNDNNNNKEIIVLINQIKEHEICIEREKENLQTFKTLNEKNIFNNRKVLHLIENWNQIKYNLSEENRSEELVVKTEDNRSEELVVKTEENNIEIKAQVVIESVNTVNEKIDYNSDQDFNCMSEGLVNIDFDFSSDEEMGINGDQNIGLMRERDVKKKLRRGIEMSQKEIHEKLSNNECVTEIDKNNELIKIIYLNESNNKIQIGFGCAWSECQILDSKRQKILSHIKDKHNTQDLQKLLDSNEAFVELDECNELIKLYRLENEININNSILVGYGCNWKECDYNNRKKLKVIEHIRQRHTNEKPIECSECNYRTHSNKSLTKHKYSKHKPNSINYVCDDCDFTTRYKTSYTNHRDRHLGVPEVRPHKCLWPACEFSAPNQSKLNRHMMLHTDSRPYRCEWPECEWAFRVQGHLEAHMIIHRGERPFKCEWPACEMAFRSPGAFRAHSVVHTREKKFACSWPECKSTFRDRAGLKLHLMYHNNERPIICEDKDCGKRFRAKNQMLRHFKLKHKKNN